MDGKQCASSVLGLANQIKRVSYDDRLKKILPTSHTVEMKE